MERVEKGSVFPLPLGRGQGEGAGVARYLSLIAACTLAAMSGGIVAIP
jgi:hypothetical protein